MENTPLKMGALMAGQIDLVASTADEFPIYMKPDTPVRYILAVDNSNGGDGVAANKDITAIADLRGRTVAFEEGSVSQFSINALLLLDLARNREMYGTAGNPGQLHKTLSDAITIWSGSGKVQVTGLTAADVLDDSYLD